MAANLRDPGLIPGGDPKRFQDSSNYVFHIVGECKDSFGHGFDLQSIILSTEDCPRIARHTHHWCWAWVLGFAL